MLVLWGVFLLLLMALLILMLTLIISGRVGGIIRLSMRLYGLIGKTRIGILMAFSSPCKLLFVLIFWVLRGILLSLIIVILGIGRVSLAPITLVFIRWLSLLIYTIKRWGLVVIEAQIIVKTTSIWIPSVLRVILPVILVD